MADFYEEEGMSGEFDDGGITEGEMPVEIVGFSFKKFKKFAVKAVNPIDHLKMTAKLAKKGLRSPLINPIETIKAGAKIVAKNPMAALMPPVAAFKLLKEATSNRPAAVAKVEAIKEAAEEGDPSAQAAFTNMVMANEIQKEGVQPEQVFEDYPPDDVPYDEYMRSEGYEDGPVDAVGSLWGKLKKLGPTLDFTNPKNPLRSAVSAIPLIGPGVLTAGDMLAKAKSGAKDALSKIDQVKKLAASGDPTAKQALSNLMAANAIDKAAEAGAEAGARARKVYDWLPGIKLYRQGMGTKTA